MLRWGSFSEKQPSTKYDVGRGWRGWRPSRVGLPSWWRTLASSTWLRGTVNSPRSISCWVTSLHFLGRIIVNFTNVNYHRLYPAQIGGNLDTKGYGIATRPGSGFKDLLDQASTFLDGCVPTNDNGVFWTQALLQMQENGDLHRLKVKWWKQKRGGGRCQKSVVKSAEVEILSIPLWMFGHV